MRVLLLVPLTACLSSPTGLDQTWPPPGAEIVAATAIDHPGANSDVAIAVAGDHPGIYLVTADEIAIGGDPQISTFTAFYARPIERPIALYDNRGELVVASRADDGVALETLDAGTLELLETETLAIQEPEGTLWIHEIVFPGGMPRLALGSEGEIKHMPDDVNAAMANNIPSPTGPEGWMRSRFAYGFTDSSNADIQSAVVVTDTDVFKSPIPAGGGQSGFGAEDWISLRPSRLWRGPAAGDLDEDGVLEVFGIDGGTLCGLDPTVATTPVCLAVPAPPTGELAMFVAKIDPDPITDIMMVFSDEGRARVSLLDNCTLTDNALTCERVHEGSDVDIDAAIPVLIRLDGATDVLLLGRDGATACDPGAGSC